MLHQPGRTAPIRMVKVEIPYDNVLCSPGMVKVCASAISVVGLSVEAYDVGEGL